MTQADSVLSTPPTNTSAIDQPMFPPRDPTRRRFLAISAGASFVGTGSLAAAAMAPNDVPQAVTMPIGPDPIYAVIEQHRKAAREHTEAIDLEAAYAGRTLVNTRPTTLAGIRALCRYIEPLFGETDQPDLPDHIDYEDDASACIPEAFAYVIGRAIEELMKTVQT
jgi:hypothetical protein